MLQPESPNASESQNSYFVCGQTLSTQLPSTRAHAWWQSSPGSPTNQCGMPSVGLFVGVAVDGAAVGLFVGLLLGIDVDGDAEGLDVGEREGNAEGEVLG